MNVSGAMASRFLYTLPLPAAQPGAARDGARLGGAAPGRPHGRAARPAQPEPVAPPGPVRHGHAGPHLLRHGGSFFFGWAKPVPIAPWNFKDPQRGMMLVGAAGPLMNFAIAGVAAGVGWLLYTWSAAVGAERREPHLSAQRHPGPCSTSSRCRRWTARASWAACCRATAYRAWAQLDRYGMYTVVLAIVLYRPAAGVLRRHHRRRAERRLPPAAVGVSVAGRRSS